MAATIIPAFRSAQAEAEIIGRILAGYSELEVELLQCVMLVIDNDVDKAVRTLYSARGERRRLDNANAILHPAYVKSTLQAEWSQCFDDLDYCRVIRNQYAHCQWYHTVHDGLCFIDLENLTKQTANIAALTPHRHPIDVTLLSSQEQFFDHVQKCLWCVAEQYSHSLLSNKPNALWPWPGSRARPSLHN
jgi:hypothetical protein